MSTKVDTKDRIGGDFEFNSENLEKAKNIISRYPEGKQASAVMGLLDLAQRQIGWISKEVVDYIAKFLAMPAVRVEEIVTFYTMYNKKKVGKYFIQVCRTTSCWLRGSDDLVKACKDYIGIDLEETSNDKKFTLVEVECLGACANAPMVQINDDYYEDLDPDIMKDILTKLSEDKVVKTGSQKGRRSSEPKPEYLMNEEK